MKQLRRFFFPPIESSRLRRLLPLGMLVALPAVIVIATIPAWDYSNSPDFCGKTCHTMPPEYNTYLVSPHARVLCVDCHIGRGSFFQQFIRKSVHLGFMRHRYGL
jgi:nitrate/TMAO reductase-like tetraheme cytochrome c subunit